MEKPCRLRFPILMFVAALCLHASAHGEPVTGTVTPSYALKGVRPLPGATRWDYLAFDAATHRLFMTRGDHVDVLDVTSGHILGSIAHTAGVHGVALAQDLKRGFISDGTANTVTIFDLVTLNPLATVATGTKPDALVYDPGLQEVFVANGNSNNMTVIRAQDGEVVETIPLDGKPEFAVIDGKGSLYVNIEDKSEIAIIDSKAQKVTGYIKLAPSCVSPTGLAIDIRQNRLFSVCSNQSMVVVQAETRKIIETLPIGSHSDAAIFDPATALAFSSNGEGTLTVVGATSSQHYKVLQTVVTRPSARTMALDPLTHTLYLAAAEPDASPQNSESHSTRPSFKSDSFMILTVAPDAPALNGASP